MNRSVFRHKEIPLGERLTAIICSSAAEQLRAEDKEESFLPSGDDPEILNSLV